MQIHRIARPRPEKAGAVLMLALFALIPMAALTYALMRIGSSFSRENLSGVEEEQALLIAEAGLEESLLGLRSGSSGNVGSDVNPVYFGGGLFWVEVRQVGASLFLARSSAMYESGRACLERLVFRTSSDLLGTSIFSNQDFTIDSNVFVDSFDSALGSYASQVSGGHAMEGAQIQSNGDVTVESAVEVHGDIYPGDGNTLSAPGSAEITGSTQPMDQPRIIPKVTTPSLISLGSRFVASSITVPSGNYRFDKIEIDADLTITGPAVVVVDDITLRSNSSITFDTASGPIVMYVSGEFIQASNSDMITTSGAATDMMLYLSGDSSQVVDFRSNSDFYGVIYAPDATVSIASNFRVYGAIVADSIDLASNAQIHYDEQLRRARLPDAQYTAVSWAPVALPVARFQSDRSDPFRLVGIDRNVMNLPEAGHAP